MTKNYLIVAIVLVVGSPHLLKAQDITLAKDHLRSLNYEQYTEQASYNLVFVPNAWTVDYPFARQNEAADSVYVLPVHALCRRSDRFKKSSFVLTIDEVALEANRLNVAVSISKVLDCKKGTLHFYTIYRAREAYQYYPSKRQWRFLGTKRL